MNQALIKLPYRFMHLRGVDAEKFLQGQCSIDISELGTKEFSFGTFNDPKGRMYCLFKACRFDDGILLSIHDALYDDTLSILNKYKVFFKCEIEERDLIAYGLLNKDYAANASDEISNLVSALDEHDMASNQNAIALKVPNSSLIEVWLPQGLQLKSIEANNEWLIYLCKAGVPQLDDMTREKFILQELNLQELGAVSFKKGCYTGQEIIARMKYLGKQKKRMFLLESKHVITAKALETVFDKEQKKLGKIICGAATSELGSAYLAVLNTEAAEACGIASIGEEELNIKSLSYEI